MLRILEKEQERQEKKYTEKYGSDKYTEMPFKPGTVLQAESRLMRLAGDIRELRTDMNRLVYQSNDQEVIEWYERTNKEEATL